MKYDIIVGIPSYNEEDSINFVLEQMDKGLKKYYPDKKALIINGDGCSQDNTVKFFLNAKTKTQKESITLPIEKSGKGYALKAIFEKIKEYDAKYSMVVDSDLKSIKPSWVKLMIEPVIMGFDYVTPVYARHKFDGTITNNLTRPFVYGVLGKKIVQPIGGEFAFSRKLSDYWLKQEWTENNMKYGIDIFMTINAILGDFKICQVCLGEKVHKPSIPKLEKMFMEVADSLFSILSNNKEKWIHNELIEEIATFGENLVEIENPEMDFSSQIENARNIFENSKEYSKTHLSSKSYEKIKKGFDENNGLGSDEWVLAVYDTFRKYDFSQNKKEVLKGLMPAYFLRTINHFNQIKYLENNEAEKIVNKQAELFRQNRKMILPILNQ